MWFYNLYRTDHYYHQPLSYVPVLTVVNTVFNQSHRREALYTWKRRLGSEATYQKLIDIFECAGHHICAELVRNIILCESENEIDDFSDYDEPIPQPETYPHVTLSSPKFTNRKLSSCDEYLLVNQANVQDLPKGQN